ncbi:MAG: hypothetical protein J1F23_03830 [Oscillospiraceae bacterium]|nr:hypothetical protein [Oscillospiraceae bacterium]
MKKRNRFLRVIMILLVVLTVFKTVDFALSELTDKKAYRDAVSVSEEEWNGVFGKVAYNETLTDSDYELILSQTGLGKPAVDKLITEGNVGRIEEYREFYLMDKDYVCYREGVFACHEAITDENGERITNPDFADIQNGDILITLSIHSLGWRHGHAAVVVDAQRGITAEAVMFGKKSSYGKVKDWKNYPLVAVLRLKDADESIRNEIAQFTDENMIGIYYGLLAGVIWGRNTENIPVTTQCAHFVWFVYKNAGIDIDSDGGTVITPKDILESENLETVQIYGNIKEM